MHRLFTAAALLALATASTAQQPAKGGAPPPVPPDYQKLVDDFAAESAKVSAASKKLQESEEYKKAVADKDREAVNKLREGLPKVDRQAYAERALAAADKRKGDDRARFLVWALSNGAPKEIGNKAIDALIDGHLESPIMRDYVSSSGFVYGVGALDKNKTSDRLAKVRESKDPYVKAWAMYAEATMLQRGKDASAEDKAKAAELTEQAAKLGAGTDLADRIAGPAFEKERLQIGMEAPDIAADDLHGVGFKLSDYRGKVVVLDFWGDW